MRAEAGAIAAAAAAEGTASMRASALKVRPKRRGRQTRSPNDRAYNQGVASVGRPAAAVRGAPTLVSDADALVSDATAKSIPRETARNVRNTTQVSSQVKTGVTRAVEIPSGPSSAELLETFAQTLEDVFEKVDENAAAGERGDAPRTPKTASGSRAKRWLIWRRRRRFSWTPA